MSRIIYAMIIASFFGLGAWFLIYSGIEQIKEHKNRK